MKKILISINPEHVDNIVRGLKKYEYRRKVAKQDINKIIVYSTYPIKKVVAEVEIISILEASAEELWELTKSEGCVSKDFFDSYFKNRNPAYAYKLGKVTKFEEPLELKEFGVKVAPQSFVYI
ncbi:MAG: ASCH domain-containing protein [Bacilli bacterium]|nr:ASCH domain-containing protein [Bacilli bacterium]